MSLDGSETATLGLSEAIRLAKKQGAKIKLVHIVNELIVVLPEAYVDIGRVVDSLRRSGETILANGEAAVRGAGVEVDTTLVEAMGNAAGDPIMNIIGRRRPFSVYWMATRPDIAVLAMNLSSVSFIINALRSRRRCHG